MPFLLISYSSPLAICLRCHRRFYNAERARFHLVRQDPFCNFSNLTFDRFGLGQRTELENIQQQVQRNRILDHAERDTKMIYRPDWKPENKEQWIQDVRIYSQPRFLIHLVDVLACPHSEATDSHPVLLAASNHLFIDKCTIYFWPRTVRYSLIKNH